MFQNRNKNETNRCPYPACLNGQTLPDSCLTFLAHHPDYLGTCHAVQLNQLLLAQWRSAVTVFSGDLVKAYLVLEIASRHPQAQRQYHREAHDYPFSNIHSLADATGYPRETVRRKVHEMVVDGLIDRLPDGGLILSAAMVTRYQQEDFAVQSELLRQVTAKLTALPPLLPIAPAAAG